MQLTRINGSDGRPVAAAWIEGKVVELAATRDAAFADLASLLSAGEAALERAQSHAREATAAGKGVDASRVEFLSPTTPAVFLGLGCNDEALATNEGLPFNKHLELFAKMPGCAIGHEQPVRMPKVIDQLDFEAELAAVIGRTARRVKAKDALDYVGGYTVCNDVTAKVAPRPPESGSSSWTVNGRCAGSAPRIRPSSTQKLFRPVLHSMLTLSTNALQPRRTPSMVKNSR
jgi:2-keto-4-pentenoate hydratase/2-oxohepta-3-ene-1,7-dioic acid hydratase in catechol pathway